MFYSHSPLYFFWLIYVSVTCHQHEGLWQRPGKDCLQPQQKTDSFTRNLWNQERASVFSFFEYQAYCFIMSLHKLECACTPVTSNKFHEIHEMCGPFHGDYLTSLYYQDFLVAGKAPDWSQSTDIFQNYSQHQGMRANRGMFPSCSKKSAHLLSEWLFAYLFILFHSPFTVCTPQSTTGPRQQNLIRWWFPSNHQISIPI